MKLALAQQVKKRGGIKQSSERVGDYYPLKGGLNLVDSELEIPPGELLDVKNYEPIYTSGYAVLKGSERYDGNISPSDAEYVYCTLNKEEEAGQELDSPRNAAHASWQSIGTPTKATVTGYDGVADAGFSLEDNDAGAHEGVYQNENITGEGAVFILQMFIEKKSSTAYYPHVIIGDHVVANNRVHFGIDTVNGKVYPSVEGGSTYAYKDAGLASHCIDWNDDYWLFTFPWINADANIQMRVTLYPAYSASANHGAIGTTSVTGTTNFDLVCIYEVLAQNGLALHDPGDYRPHERVPEQRDLTGPGWSYSNPAPPIITATGYDGVPGTASRVEDVSTAINQTCQVSGTTNANQDGAELWEYSVIVNRTYGTPSYYPVVKIAGGGAGGADAYIHIDTTNLRLIDDDTNPTIMMTGVQGINADFFHVWMISYKAAATTWSITLYPAGCTVLGTMNVAARGATTFDLVGVTPYPLMPNVPPQVTYNPVASEPIFAMTMTDQLMETQEIEARDYSDAAWTLNNVTVGSTGVSPFWFDDNSPAVRVEVQEVVDGDANLGYLEKNIAGFTTPDADHVFMVQLWIKKAVNKTAGEPKIGIYLGDGTYGAETMFDAYMGEFVDIADTTRKPLSTGVYNWNDQNLQSTSQAYWLVWIKFTGNLSTSINLRLYPAYATPYSAEVGASDGNETSTLDLVWPQLSWYRDSPHAAITDTIDTSGARTIITATNKIGQWHKGEIVWANGYPIGQLNSDPLTTAPTTVLDDAAKLAARVYARAKIGQVPGANEIRGIVQYNGLAYGFRDNTAEDEVDVYKAVPNSGWKSITLSQKLRFITGTTEISVGDEVTGVTSSATAHVKRVVKTSGSWGSGIAAGYLLIGLVNGTFNASEVLQVSAGNVATTNGAVEAQTFPVGGRYDFRVYNFGGHAGTKRIYGVNGVGNAFDLDSNDDTICQIETGMTTDKPTHIAFFKHKLVLSFSGGSVQMSGVESPLVWRVITGALEIGIGEEVSDFIEEVGKSLIVLGRNQTFVISDEGSLKIDLINRESGCIPYTAQRLSQGMYLDDRGITTVPAVQAYGNFKTNTVSRKINPLIDQLRGLAISSHVSRSRNLFRLSFSDNTNIAVGFDGRKTVGATKTNYGFPLRVVHSYEDENGDERIFAGSDSGFIYELDKGSSLDGAAIDAYLYPAYYNSRSPRTEKRYRSMGIDLVSEGDTTLTVSVRINNNRTANNQPDQAIAIVGTTQSRKEVSVPLEATGRNIQPRFDYSESDEDGHELHGIVLRHTKRHTDRVTRRS